MQTWKAYEYEFAKFFGARRRKMRKYVVQGPDLDYEFADIEVKTRKSIPGWITKPLRKTKKWSKSKIAAVVYVNPGSPVEDGLVVLEAPDFRILLQSLAEHNPNSPVSASGQSSEPIENLSESGKTATPKSRWKRSRRTWPKRSV